MRLPFTALDNDEAGRAPQRSKPGLTSGEEGLLYRLAEERGNSAFDLMDAR